MAAEAEARSFHGSQVEDVERQWFAALQRHDTATLDRILADDYVFIGPNGQTSTKAAIQDLNRPEYRRLDLDEVRVRVYGESAVLTARIAIHGPTVPSDVAGTYRHTRVYVRQRGQWRAVSGHSTKISSAL